MADMADMLIYGDVCSECGSFIFEDGEPTTGDGHPRLCPDCARERASRGAYSTNRPNPRKKRRRR